MSRTAHDKAHNFSDKANNFSDKAHNFSDNTRNFPAKAQRAHHPLLQKSNSP
jgi:hypothetical protein